MCPGTGTKGWGWGLWRGLGVLEGIAAVLKQVWSLYGRLGVLAEGPGGQSPPAGLRSRTQSSGGTREPQVSVGIQQVEHWVDT